MIFWNGGKLRKGRTMKTVYKFHDDNEIETKPKAELDFKAKQTPPCQMNIRIAKKLVLGTMRKLNQMTEDELTIYITMASYDALDIEAKKRIVNCLCRELYKSIEQYEQEVIQ